MVNNMLIRAQVTFTKNTHKLFHKSLSKAKYPKSVQPTIPTRSHRFPNSDKPMPNPIQSVQPILHRCHQVQLANFLLPGFIKSVLPSFLNRRHRVAQSDRWSPHRYHRDSKVIAFWSLRYHRVLHFGVTELVTLGVTVGFLGMPIYTP